MYSYLLQHLLENTVEKFPDKIAIKHKDREITFLELQNQSMQLGRKMKTLSPQQGEKIGILLDKSIEQVLSILGILYADKVFIIINPILHQKQIKHIIEDSEITTIITSSKFCSLVKDSVEKNSIINVLKEEVFNEMEKNIGCQSIVCENISDDVSNIIYTSGSTGTPKGVVISHRNLIDTANNSTEHLKVNEDDRILCCLPLNFDYGLNQITSTILKGCTLVLYDYTVPTALLKALSDEKITRFPALPPIWASIFNPKLCRVDEEIVKYDFSNLKYIYNTGAKLPVPHVKRIRELFPKVELFLMYGFTEAFRSTFLDPKEVDKRPDSVGKALPSVKIEIIDKDGNPCKPGEVGELIHRGSGLAKGYWKSPELTAGVYRQNPLLQEGGMYNDVVAYSGDFAKKDEEGFIYFVDRKDCIIKTSGYRVSTIEVESLIMGCEGVSEVVVFGLQDDMLGKKIRAVVVAENKTANDIKKYCEKEAPFYMVPKEVFIATNLPKTSTGKLDRPRIKELSISKYGQ